MIADINRWVLLAALAAAQAATVALQAHAQPLDRIPESVRLRADGRAHALRAARLRLVRWRCSLRWRNRETPSHS